LETIIIALAVLATAAGGMLALRFTKYMHHFNAFAAGILLGAAFFEIIPEAVELGDAHTVSGAVIVGFLAFYAMQRFTIIHSCHGEHDRHAHDHECSGTGHTHNIGIIGAAGLAAHRFLDGAAIGFGFAVNPLLGLAIGIAVIAHGFGDGVSTVAIMLRHKNSKNRTMTLLAVSAVAPLVGALLTLNMSISQSLLGMLLGFFAGVFIYLSTSDLLPEAHHSTHRYSVFFTTIAGAALIFIVSKLIH
jgi:ZIP family zinc transporter